METKSVEMTINRLTGQRYSEISGQISAEGLDQIWLADGDGGGVYFGKTPIATLAVGAECAMADRVDSLSADVLSVMATANHSLIDTIGVSRRIDGLSWDIGWGLTNISAMAHETIDAVMGLSGDVQATKNAADSTYAQLTGAAIPKIDSAYAQLTATNSTVNAVKSAVNTVNSTVGSTKTAVDSLGSKIDSLSADVARIRTGGGPLYDTASPFALSGDIVKGALFTAAAPGTAFFTLWSTGANVLAQITVDGYHVGCVGKSPGDLDFIGTGFQVNVDAGQEVSSSESVCAYYTFLPFKA